MKQFPTPPLGGYRIIYADPPWANTAYKKSSRHASNKYSVMNLEDIKALPVCNLASKDCWLFLWSTWPHLTQALDVMRAWGFKYSSNGFIWAKLKPGEPQPEMFSDASFVPGTGLTTRKCTEPCLLGKRGNPGRLNMAIKDLIIAPRRAHSQKPDQARAQIEKYCAGPRLEMFARTSAPGWDVWGNETNKFEAAG